MLGEFSKKKYAAIPFLQERSNMPVTYSEAEIFAAGFSRANRTVFRGLDMRTVDVESSYADVFNIKRKFRKAYAMEELAESNSPDAILIIEQMVSDDYAKRSAAAYLKIAIMGGNYFSIARATEIINASRLDDDAKNRLIRTLKRVDEHEGIHKAKMALNSESALYEFIGGLNALVELGINPVVIPEIYRIHEIPNPVLNLGRYSKWDRGGMNASSRIEVQEHIGGARIDWTTE